ncbi:hypothetical protein NLO413_0897 [Candidatus Neoehrlichia lotoris str. RAC413]|uniref:Uncharacterized protein n=1 Tax=Candidatus Neoehrlichia procyonis str. RAC413 TaxID=1359163 RepID=A0A0F3NRG8_9RICK|nr:hypothetical protein NLO413_0897 [Candidatus Neoehrlichia lotoris str. RAC413]
MPIIAIAPQGFRYEKLTTLSCKQAIISIFESLKLSIYSISEVLVVMCFIILA